MSATSITKRNIIILSLILVFVVFLAKEARAEIFNFYAITSNSTVDPGYGEAQLTVDVTDEGTDISGDTGFVEFTLQNNIPDIDPDYPMFISDIYLLRHMGKQKRIQVILNDRFPLVVQNMSMLESFLHFITRLWDIYTRPIMLERKKYVMLVRF